MSQVLTRRKEVGEGWRSLRGSGAGMRRRAEEPENAEPTREGQELAAVGERKGPLPQQEGSESTCVPGPGEAAGRFPLRQRGRGGLQLAGTGGGGRERMAEGQVAAPPRLRRPSLTLRI